MLMLDFYSLQMVWSARLLSYFLLDNISKISLVLWFLSNKVMLYVIVFSARMVCGGGVCNILAFVAFQILHDAFHAIQCGGPAFDMM